MVGRGSASASGLPWLDETGERLVAWELEGVLVRTPAGLGCWSSVFLLFHLKLPSLWCYERRPGLGAGDLSSGPRQGPVTVSALLSFLRGSGPSPVR